MPAKVVWSAIGEMTGGGLCRTVTVPEARALIPAQDARILALPVTWPVKNAFFCWRDGTKSPLATPPDTFTRDQDSAATLATKLPVVSRATAKTVIVLDRKSTRLNS